MRLSICSVQRVWAFLWLLAISQLLEGPVSLRMLLTRSLSYPKSYTDIYPLSQAPQYRMGHGIAMGTLALAFTTATSMLLSRQW